MSGKTDIDALRRKVKTGLTRGAVFHGPTRAEWDAAGNCTSPVSFEDHAWPTRSPEFRYLHGQPGFEWFDDRNPTIVTPKTTEGRRGKSHGLSLTMHVPCRRCENCLKRRAAHWRMRMHQEQHTSFRTWFGTVTLHPDMQHFALSAARATSHDRVVEWNELSEEAQFGRVTKVIYSEMQRYFKRLRKSSGSALRYIAIAERHKSGYPHLHVLIHEKRFDQPIRKKLLEAQWRWGFTKWNLVADDRQISYVAKYLSKSLLVRVRASQGYGVQVTSYDTGDKKHGPRENLDPSPQLDNSQNMSGNGTVANMGGLINGAVVPSGVSPREQVGNGLSKAADLANGEPDAPAATAVERFAKSVGKHWPAKSDAQS